MALSLFGDAFVRAIISSGDVFPDPISAPGPHGSFSIGDVYIYSSESITGSISPRCAWRTVFSNAKTHALGRWGEFATLGIPLTQIAPSLNKAPELETRPFGLSDIAPSSPRDVSGSIPVGRFIENA